MMTHAADPTSAVPPMPGGALHVLKYVELGTGREIEFLSQPFDGYRHNETAKAMATLLEDAAGGPYDPTEQDWLDLAAQTGINLDDYKC